MSRLEESCLLCKRIVYKGDVRKGPIELAQVLNFRGAMCVRYSSISLFQTVLKI
jgi:hypothetical protein